MCIVISFIYLCFTINKTKDKKKYQNENLTKIVKKTHNILRVWKQRWDPRDESAFPQ